MKAQLDITHNILDQFAAQLNINSEQKQLHLNSQIGKGSIRFTELPNQLELYHFNFNLAVPFEIESQNPRNSDWLLININLSEKEVKKKVNDQDISFQKYLPSGMLFYTPETEIFSVSPPNVPFSIVLIRFHRSLIEQYQSQHLNRINKTISAVIYEDLDFNSERLLEKCLLTDVSEMLLHAYLLEFLGLFFQKLQYREIDTNYENIHPSDLKSLFLASSYLRNPFEKTIPSIDDLSKMAGMGVTKFNNCFKQVFGTTPLQYNLRIKMEHARDQLIRKQASPSEISYQLGYSHPSKFTSAFKKQFGVPPSEV